MKVIQLIFRKEMCKIFGEILVKLKNVNIGVVTP